MFYSTAQLVIVIKPVLVCLLFSQWPSITGVLGSCNEDQYWDNIAGSCSSCTGICGIYDKKDHRDCLCICFPENRECKGKEFDPSGLATKSDVSSHQVWLIILTIVVVGFILWRIVAYYKERRTVSRSTKKYGKKNPPPPESKTFLPDKDDNQASCHKDQADKPDVPEETVPKTINEPGPSSAGPSTGISAVQEEGRKQPDQGLVRNTTFVTEETIF